MTSPAATGPDAPPGSEADLARLRAGLTFDTAVSRRLTHRASVSEVIPTDAVQAGPAQFLVAAQAPRSHLLFNDGPDRFLDMLVLVETVRQGGTVVAHRFLDVPLDLAFVLRSADLEVLDLEALRSASRPSEIVADLTLSDIGVSKGVVTRMAAEAVLRVDGRVAARGGGAMTAVPIAAYQRVRPRSLKQSRTPAVRPAEPLSPEQVGRTHPRNVVVGTCEGAADSVPELALLVDRSHPHFFDHPQDHVPGTLLLEALRQAAVVVGADVLGALPQDLVVTSCDLAFQRYVELDRPATCRVRTGRATLPRRGGPVLPLVLEVRQGDVVAAKADLCLTVATPRRDED